MSLSVSICITAGTSSLNIVNIYSNVDSYATPVQQNIPIASLIAPNCPYVLDVPNNTSIIRILDNTTRCRLDIPLTSNVPGCGILFTDGNSGLVFYYNVTTNQTVSLPVPGANYSADIAHTTDKLWLVGTNSFIEYNITLQPFSAILNRVIPYPAGYTASPGLGAINNYTILAVNNATTPYSVVEINVSGPSAVMNTQFFLNDINRRVSGDFFKTTTNKFIVTLSTRTGTPIQYFIAQYDYLLGTLDIEIPLSITSNLGIFEDNGNIYIGEGNQSGIFGNVYQIATSSPYNVTLINNTGLFIAGASQVPDCLTVDFSIAPSQTPTSTQTPTPTPTVTPTIGLSPTPTSTKTPTPTVTPTVTTTITKTPTVTPTVTITNTPTKTVTPTITKTPTITPTRTVTPTITTTPTVTPTITPTSCNCWNYTIVITAHDILITSGNTNFGNNTISLVSSNDTVYYCLGGSIIGVPEIAFSTPGTYNYCFPSPNIGGLYFVGHQNNISLYSPTLDSTITSLGTCCETNSYTFKFADVCCTNDIIEISGVPIVLGFGNYYIETSGGAFCVQLADRQVPTRFYTYISHVAEPDCPTCQQNHPNTLCPSPTPTPTRTPTITPTNTVTPTVTPTTPILSRKYQTKINMCDTGLLNYRINVTKNNLPFEDYIVVDSDFTYCPFNGILTPVSTFDIIEVNGSSDTLPFNFAVYGLNGGVNTLLYSANTYQQNYTFTIYNQYSTYELLVWDNIMPPI
jgi:hypothetical protein